MAHGTGQRSGYDVMLVNVKENKVTGQQVFASGWLDEASQEVWGRPVDVLVMPDGALLVSDDYAGVIYRISHSG